jgi:hypothetical protein
MAKVRWSTKCAGGCGKWLLSGSFALRKFGGWWCDDCVAAHRRILVGK